MKSKRLFILVCLPLLAEAGQLYRCDENGETFYQDKPCPGDATATYDEKELNKPSGWLGLREGQKQMLEEIRVKERRRYLEKRAADQRYIDRHASFDEEMRLRELEMRRREVMRSLNRGGNRAGKGIVLREELRNIDHEIERIRSPRY